MSTSTHDAALFEEGFALVRVEESDVHTYGAQALFDMIQEHPWVLEQELPVLIVYPTSQGMQAYGHDELVEAVQQIPFEDITWGHEITLEWEDEDEEEYDEEEEE
ncbi:MAG TPA: hypothetical protein VGE07_18545 [Herpetosiphonaceae bacterium]